MPQTFLWYDLETFGTRPRWDRIAQFAAIRTSYRFEPIGDPISVFCRMSPEYLPEPDACLLTGLTPRIVNEKGVAESELARIISREMSVPGTCVAGYNTIRFDDEFIRNLFYRNFHDPYRREYEEGNSRWDILGLVRMTHDLRPAGINWIDDDAGKPVFRLEDLAAANGIQQDRAHDAVWDVRATIALARLVFEKQPKLFRFFYRLRKKDEVRRLLNLQQPAPVLHTSSVYTRPGGCTTVIYPLSVHPDQVNQVIVYDLRFDPSDWVELPVEEIRRRVFAREEQLGGTGRVHLRGVHLNRVPAIAPVRTLPPERAAALGLDLARCNAHAAKLAERSDLVRKIRAVFAAGASSRREPRDPELQIYSGGFFGDQDRETFEHLHDAPPEELVQNPPQFVDSRGAELFRRYLGRNHFELLPQPAKDRWISYCASRLLAPELDEVLDYARYRRMVENLLNRTDTPADKKRIIRDLVDYADWLETNVLQYR